MFGNASVTTSEETGMEAAAISSRSRHGVDVVLIQPPTKKDCVAGPTLATTENLGLAYLSSMLSSSGIPNSILDAEAGRCTEDEVAGACARSGARVFCISPAAINMGTSIAISEKLKNTIPRSIVLFGGHHATLCYREILSHEHCVDAIVLGEAEDIIVPLVRALLDGTRAYTHPSVARRGDLDNRRINVIECLDSLPYPVRSFDGGDHDCRLLTGRGCIGSCSFCTTPELFHSLRRRSIANILGEIHYLAANGKYRFWLNDDLFISAHPACHRFAHDLSLAVVGSGLDITFRPMIRADSLNGRYDTLKVLESAGMTHVFVGIESGNDLELTKFNKHVTREENAQCLHFLKDEPVVTQIGFIMFTPWSSPRTLCENMQFLSGTRQAYRAFPLFRVLSVFPHTLAHRLISEEGLIGALSYCSEDPFAYRFHSSVVGELARAQHLAYPKVAGLDNTIYREVSNLRLLGLLSEENELRAAATQANTRFFNRIVRLTEYSHVPLDEHALAVDDLRRDLSRIASQCSVSSEICS